MRPGPLDSAECASGVHQRCFALAAWMLDEVVKAAGRVQPRLKWDQVLGRRPLPSDLEARVVRAVLEPLSRHAPGILAMSEIVAAVPAVAARHGVAPSKLEAIAQRAATFAVHLAQSGTDVQVLVRNYLALPAATSASPAPRVLDPALLTLGPEMALTTITPVEELLSLAKAAVQRHIGPAQGVCVALRARAPSHVGVSMFDAIWSAYTAAAARLIFVHIDACEVSLLPVASPDPNAAAALDALARRRAADLRCGVSAQAWVAARKEFGLMWADVDGRAMSLSVPSDAKSDAPADSAGSQPIQQHRRRIGSGECQREGIETHEIGGSYVKHEQDRQRR